MAKVLKTFSGLKGELTSDQFAKTPGLKAQAEARAGKEDRVKVNTLVLQLLALLFETFHLRLILLDLPLLFFAGLVLFLKLIPDYRSTHSTQASADSRIKRGLLEVGG